MCKNQRILWAMALAVMCFFAVSPSTFANNTDQTNLAMTLDEGLLRIGGGCRCEARPTGEQDRGDRKHRT